MYSGTTIRIKSGRIMGAHQKIDRVARKRLDDLLPNGHYFPSIHDILHFEGKNGPDGIKRKSPSIDEPWHYIDPTNENDTVLYGYIEDHIHNLVTALVQDNRERAAFEAAWLAHAITDGLTPAHHYPLSDKIEELFGKPKEERLTVRGKNVIRGKNRRDTFARNWQYWGAKGIFTNHIMFEFGVASTISTLRFKGLAPNSNQLVRVKKEGILPMMKDAVWKVYELDMYNEFEQSGWTRALARTTRTELAPLIISTVMLAWYYASERAQQKRAAS